MEKFWIIPILALIGGSTMGAGAIEYKINTILPNAAIEFVELNEMSCLELKEKNSIGKYWTPDNGKYAREKIDTCLLAENAIKQLERDRINKLLADSTSQESLEKKLLKLIDLSNTYMPLLFEHREQAQIFQGNLTDFENEIDSIMLKMGDFGYLDNNGCIEMETSDDFPMISCINGISESLQKNEN